MKRSGYTDDFVCGSREEQWAMICYRGAVNSALRGKRGQAFLRELVAALEAMPVKELIAHELVEGGQVCALGAVGMARGLDLENIDAYEPDEVADKFGIAEAMAREIVYENDDCYAASNAKRYEHMLQWAKKHIKTQETVTV